MDGCDMTQTFLYPVLVSRLVGWDQKMSDPNQKPLT